MSFLSLAAFLLGATIGSIEYTLPEKAKEWVTVHKVESKTETTLVLSPSKEENKEAFIVSFYPGTSSIKEDTDIQKTLSLRFPGLKTEVTVLNRDKDSIFYEFSIKDPQDKLIVYGMSRLFSLPDGVTVINFSTENEAFIKEGKALWEPVLKEAHEKTTSLP